MSDRNLALVNIFLMKQEKGGLQLREKLLKANHLFICPRKKINNVLKIIEIRIFNFTKTY